MSDDGVRVEPEVVRPAVVVPVHVGRFTVPDGHRGRAVMVNARDVAVYETLRDAVGVRTAERAAETGEDLRDGWGLVDWSAAEFSDRTGVPVAAVERSLRRLRRCGLIFRVYSQRAYGLSQPPCTGVVRDVPLDVGDVYLEVTV